MRGAGCDELERVARRLLVHTEPGLRRVISFFDCGQAMKRARRTAERDASADVLRTRASLPPDDRTRVVDSELWPEELKGKVGLLFDAQKRLIGLEVLEASSHLPEAVLDGQGS
jgi:hypothetical protein